MTPWSYPGSSRSSQARPLRLLAGDPFCILRGLMQPSLLTDADPLAGIPLFLGLEPSVRERVARRLVERTLGDGELLFREGDPGGTLFVVLEGELEITIRGITMERVGPGGIVGEMAFVDDSPRAASVSALLDSKVAEVPAARFDEIVRKDPAFARVLLSIVAERLRKMNRYL